MIFQVHKNHGKHISYNNLEARANEDNGWETVTENEFYGTPKEAPVDDIGLSREDLVELYEAKFDKKPHHKLSDAKIQAALSE